MSEQEVTSGLGELRDRVGRLETGFSEMRDELTRNSESTKRVEENTSSLVEFFGAMQGLFKLLNWCGKIAKPVSYILASGAALVGLFTAWKSGIGPR